MPFPAWGEVVLNDLFGDNMVLQRGQVIPIWGQAAPGEVITVEFAGQKKIVHAIDGRWRVDLDPLAPTSEPRSLRISGENSFVIKNVLVGDVWLASGQSNMGFPLSGSTHVTEALARAEDPSLRLFTAGRVCSAEARSSIGGKWTSSTVESAKSFSAAGRQRLTRPDVTGSG